MNKKLIRVGEQFLIIAGLQLFVLHYFRGSVAPSFFLVWILLLSWEGDKEISLAAAFATGVMYDIMAKGITGISAIVFLVIAYANCFMNPRSLAGRFFGVFFFSVFYFLFLLLEYRQGFLWGSGALWKYSILFAFYNAFILFIIELGMRKLRLKWKKEPLSIL